MTRDDEVPGFVEAHIALIDALWNYLRSNDELVDDFAFEGQLSREELAGWEREREPILLLLKKLEAEPVDDGTLYELLRRHE